MRVALYARVSTKDKGQDPETQLIPLRDFARAKQHQVVGEYVDVGWSGAKERRPALDGLMKAAKARKFDAILVARFDRFARSVSHLLTALAEFQKLHTDFISLSESIDTSTPMGKMVFTILGAVAEMERALIRERVQAGVDRARRQGKQLGRPRVNIEFREVSTMLTEGISIRAIAKHFGVARSTVRRVLERGEKPNADA
jgi:DNA invertase Pin-like site-specific DNA recombinase